MKLSNLLNGLHRAPWIAVARHILERAHYDTARGYPKTVKAILEEQEDPAKIGDLAGSLIEHLVAGEKYIQFVQLHKGERAGVEAWIKSKRKHSNDLTDAYPGVAAESAIIPFYQQDPTSLGFVELEEGVAALFTAARSYVHSVPVPATSLKAGAASGFERIVGYKSVFVQTYDAIWLPSSGDFVVLAVDYPGNGPKQNFPHDGAAYLNHLLRQHLGRVPKVANFWHAVDGLYVAKDGKLVDYGFSVSGQSVNHHKARRRTALCLRKAVYDSGGAAAVKAAGTTLELFKVAMQWGFKHHDGIVTEPEVLVPGAAADLNKTMPVVNHSVVRGCLTTSDLGLVVSKLWPHIKHWI